MQNYDALIVGGGPAGSACARKLVQAGRRVAVLDREEFPRTKLCAGWVTPEAISDLELDVDTYPHRFSTFEYIAAHIKGFTIKINTPQHSIRRFDGHADEIMRMYDESFVRAWRLYLGGCAAAFLASTIQLYQVVFAHPDDNRIPMTRGHVYGIDGPDWDL